jgi:V/A-type H+/Na+-transporting ATPase subunit E
MALDKLRREIEEQARAEAEAIASDASSERNRIIGKAKADAEALKKRIMDEARNEAEQRKKDTLTSLDTEISEIITSAKEASIGRELRRFVPVLERRMRTKQERLIRAALKRFSEVVPPEKCVARTDKRNSMLLKNSGIDAKYEKIDGIVIESKDGRIRMDATVGGTIGSNSEAVRRVLSRGMFG